MRAPIKLAAYGLGLVLVFGVAAGAGRVLGPEQPAPAGHAMEHEVTQVEHLPGGLQIAQDGYRLDPVTVVLPVGAKAPYAFRILGPDGEAVTSYTPEHDKELHLIVVRRDLSGFQHLHPARAADGVWSLPLSVAAAGQYRVLADFRPAALDEGITLGVDVPAAGAYQPEELPPPTRTAEVDGYTVTLAGDLEPGRSSGLSLSVRKDGVPVTDLQPYLGAYGHLVALRAGDLAYLHVHPTSDTPGPDISFDAEVPSAGAYRLYLDFQHDGTVRTAEFTAVAGSE
ncbi:MAG: hypothetical protein ABW046_04345 [Actinoplanes sp.]